MFPGSAWVGGGAGGRAALSPVLHSPMQSPESVIHSTDDYWMPPVPGTVVDCGCMEGKIKYQQTGSPALIKITSFFLLMKKLKHREVQKVAQSHTACKNTIRI